VTSPLFEEILARLYCDDAFRAQFLRDPSAVLATIALSAAECTALRDIDRVGLQLAAESYAAKRERTAR